MVNFQKLPQKCKSLTTNRRHIIKSLKMNTKNHMYRYYQMKFKKVVLGLSFEVYKS